MRLKAPFKRKVSDGPSNSTPARSKDFPPILPFNNSIHSFGWHSPSHHQEVLQSKESRRQSLTKAFHLSFSRSMRRIQQPSDSRTLVKSGPCLTNFAMHCGGYIVSLCSRSSSQQLQDFSIHVRYRRRPFEEGGRRPIGYYSTLHRSRL